MKAMRLSRATARLAALTVALAAGLAPAAALAQTQSLDFGDAPAPYPTTAQNNGARHSVTSLFLGQRVDAETDGQPNSFAQGDDSNPAGALDDEDGVTFNSLLVPGQTATIGVVASSSGLLHAWIDYNRDGDWADVGEHVFASRGISSGNNTLTFTVPTGASLGTTFARFRFCLSQDVGVTGFISGGEVEDYQVTLRQAADFGDAPASYGTLLSDNGARHAINPEFCLGTAVDEEPDGQPTADARGDDMNPSTKDDEDGLELLRPLIPGEVATVRVTCTMGAEETGRLNAWIDFNGDGTFGGEGEQIFTDQPVGPGPKELDFFVPQFYEGQPTYARFRLSRDGKIGPTGSAPDGEVEDYYIPGQQEEGMDFGDAPESFGTTLKDDGARHKVIPEFHLGQRIDSEPDGQPSNGALGDDMNPSTADDEDGVEFLTPLVAGQVAVVRIFCTMNPDLKGRLNAWIDFDGTLKFDEPTDQIFQDVEVGAGFRDLEFMVPEFFKNERPYARFRLNRDGKIGPRGPASDGEVEDYEVQPSQGGVLDFGDAPGKYPTLLAADGARHTADGKFCLGAFIDTEADGQPEASALGDDANPPRIDDEDGVAFSGALVAGQTATVLVTCTIPSGTVPGQGRLDAWVDFNGNESWEDPGEQVFVSVTVLTGLNTLTFPVPASATMGNTFARFRLSREGHLKTTGQAPDGEVEDYLVNITGALDFGDAPQPYPTLLSDNGARHVFHQAYRLGENLDLEANGQPESNALGDDANPPRIDDEDGVEFITPLVPGRPAIVRVTTPSSRGYLNAWIDFGQDGSWSQSEDRIAEALMLTPGINDIAITVPASAKTGVTFGRFRFGSTETIGFTGAAADGEVEDHLARIIPDRDRCDLTCAGREFWLTFPGNYTPDFDNPPRLSLCVQGPVGTVVAASVPGIGFSTNVVIPATASIRITIPRAAELGDLNDDIKPLGVYVLASQDILVTGFNHARYTTDSYRGLHTSIIGNRYIVLGARNLQTGVPPLNGSQFAIVGTEPDTLVQITPSVSTGSRPANVPYWITLQRGEVYQLRNTDDSPADLSGTLIRSAKPVAVFGGHRCANMPSSSVWFCDYLVEQLLPVNAWGTEFYTAPLATRSGGDTVRILAGYDNTSVAINGVVVANLDRGKFHQASLAVGARIVADKPVFVAQYANSADYDGVTKSDPFMMTVQATRHYEARYALCTAPEDFPDNFIHLVAPTGAVATIQLNGAAVGAGAFTPIAGTLYAFARLPVAPGSYLVTGGAPFAASIYGWNTYDSYGHPGCFFMGDVRPPNVTSTVSTVNVSVADYPNSPGFVPVPDYSETAQADDNCSRDLPFPSQDPRPGTLIPVGSHVVALNVMDANGNIGTAEITFNVIDPSPVRIECPQDLIVGCGEDAGAVVYFEVKASSQYDPNVPVVTDPPSGTFFPAGTTVVTAVATSPSGQTATCTFKVTVDCDRRATIDRSEDGQGFRIVWSGPEATLEQAPTPLGPWLPVVSGVNSYTAQIGNGQRYFRVNYSPR